MSSVLHFCSTKRTQVDDHVYVDLLLRNVITVLDQIQYPEGWEPDASLQNIKTSDARLWLQNAQRKRADPAASVLCSPAPPAELSYVCVIQSAFHLCQLLANSRLH